MSRGLFFALILVVLCAAGATAQANIEFQAGTGFAFCIIDPWIDFEVGLRTELGVRLFDTVEIEAFVLFPTLATFFPDAGSIAAGAELRLAPRFGRYFPAIGLGFEYGSYYGGLLSRAVPYFSLLPLRFRIGRPVDTEAEGRRPDVLLSFLELRAGPFFPTPLSALPVDEMSEGTFLFSVTAAAVAIRFSPNRSDS